MDKYSELILLDIAKTATTSSYRQTKSSRAELLDLIHAICHSWKKDGGGCDNAVEERMDHFVSVPELRKNASRRLKRTWISHDVRALFQA